MGNEFRGDDGFGSLLIKNLKNHFSNDHLKKRNVILVNGSSAPENFTGQIIKENPTHILIVDALLTNKQSRSEINNTQKIKTKGKILNINEDEIFRYNSSTHSTSLSFLIKYLSTNIDFKVFILGVEVKSMNLGEYLTEETKNNLDELQNILIKVLED
ncbi:MAG: hydrogenase maturation protease [Methanobrevibacter sp.]|nr:hydrogenase maturation protease [Candidatus Methanovirga aequatorialis]